MAQSNGPSGPARHRAVGGTNKTGAIALFLANIDSDFFTPLLARIEEAARAAGYNLLITTAGSRSQSDALPASLGRRNADGLLVFADSLSERGLAACLKKNFPVVLIYQTPPPGLAIPYVTVENCAAACHMVSHLVQEHGRRRVVFVRGPAGNQDSREREQGYRQALQQHGLESDPELIVPGEFDRNVAFTSIRRLLSSGTPFDAVFASTDEVAVGVLAALREAGRRVPEEVSVAGFDDQRMSGYLTPPLTTVRAPTEQVARQAVGQLVRLIRGSRVKRATVLHTELVLRRSCGCDNAAA